MTKKFSSCVVAAGLIVATLNGCSMQAGGGSSAEVDALRAELRELQASERIRELFSDYGRTLDERDFEAFGQLFASDAEFVGGGASGSARGPEEIAALLERLITTNVSAKPRASRRR